ncbi:hypothetical protein BDF20DRAFT_891658 [Mycotypha africana]|uniref:uncharacterized protein n=1 Tax=Mycotypha africana TaxID=64632 RepID=UPI0022FFF2C8|nr:uncharacterized protein BDF20DRAFT_891658 [Mycotypha africana]KAI8970494.1 hypothetical protein BDF20DRAFT_891658 [Mycotypha africana]
MCGTKEVYLRELNHSNDKRNVKRKSQPVLKISKTLYCSSGDLITYKDISSHSKGQSVLTKQLDFY